MVALSTSGTVRALHPLNAILLAFPLALFTAALVSDVAYWTTFHIQWANFSSWLIAGGLVVGAFALLWALIDLLRKGAAGTGQVVYFVALLAMWGLGFVNALVHAKDAWATMPESLYLSAAASLLAFASAWLGYSGFRSGEVK